MRRPHIRSLFPLVVLVALSWPLSPLDAQTGMPGGGGGSAPAHMAAYYAYVLEEVTNVTAGFEEAWRDQDLEGLRDLFHDEAALVVDSDFRVRGREAVLARLQELWSPRWQVRMSIVDFEASGDLGVIYGQLGEAPGKHITLIKRFGDDWRIVRQFLIGAEAGGGESSTP
jgi:ketosteroid isomerase-like protein